MDQDRVRAYLQVACAGLGFDIGEVWWTSNPSGSSTLAAIEEKHDETNTLTAQCGNKLHFVQLYTSKSYEEKRNMLIKPTEEEENYNALVKGSEPKENDADLEKHVLSPLLVDAISKTAQVVWAHTGKQEGLLGRSDIRLQTAVGMPVAMDGDGNMCVVVMFSPNTIQSTDDAMEYLQSISRSASSSSIPSLLPAFDPKQGLISIPHHHPSKEVIPLLSSPCLSDGVTTRFVSLDDAPISGAALALPEVHSEHDLVDAPKDCFGIPMLPSVAELGGASNGGLATVQGSTNSDAFDEASYGVWSTIMETIDSPPETITDPYTQPSIQPTGQSASQETESTHPVYAMNKPEMAKERKQRLEEFASAFLEVSVFDVAEVWIPVGGDYLGQVTSVSSTRSNTALNDFRTEGEKILIKYWSGAIGRAFSSGNPVWSANREVFVDSGRSELFSKVKIETALAVPVFSGKARTPSFIFCCYSFVRTGSVPFVLKFVQQALRLLWDGLDKVRPHKSVGEEMWRDIAPADLGEMAADVEMHEHFIVKKRPFQSISAGPAASSDNDTALVSHLQSMQVPSGVPSVRSIYTGASPTQGPTDAPSLEIAPTPISYQTSESNQIHFQNSVRSVGDIASSHHHISTNPQGSKRAHIYRPAEPRNAQPQFESINTSQYGNIQQTQTHGTQQVEYISAEPTPYGGNHTRVNYIAVQQTPKYIQPQQSTSQQPQQQQMHQQPTANQSQDYGANSNPLPMPRPLPLPNQILVHTPAQNVLQQPLAPQQQVHHGNSPTMQHSQSHAAQNSGITMTNQGQQYHPSQQQTPQMAYVNQEVQGVENQYAYYQKPQQQQQQQGHQVLAQHGYAQPHAGYTQNQPVPVSSTVSSVPMPTPVASIPTGRISATGISFPVPSNPPARPSTGMQMPSGAVKNSAALAPNGQYCMPANQTTTFQSNAKPCRIQGCDEPSVARRPYCVKHSGNRMCEHSSCSKCAQGSTRFCIAHGGGRRCTFPGCDKGARDKFFCAAHGGGKRCKFDGCNKSAVGGSNLCTAHGGGRRCAVDGCDKSAQSSTKYCVKHGGGKKCSHAGCDKVARGRTQFCAAHGGGVRCKLEGCNRVAIGKLQLCRAHGGGSRPRGRNANASPQMHPPPIAPEAVQVPGFADMASV